jgi:hypothetical protein
MVPTAFLFHYIAHRFLITAMNRSPSSFGTYRHYNNLQEAETWGTGITYVWIVEDKI